MDQLRAGGPYGLLEAAALIGSYVWWERRCFELLGSWTLVMDEPFTKAMVDRHSKHHAWRAGQWWERLPVLAQVEREDLAVAPSAAVEAMICSLSRLNDPVVRLAGAYRVGLPRLVGAYQLHQKRLSVLSDGPTIRTLAMVAADLEADWREGEAAVQSLLSTPALAHAAGHAVSWLEAILAEAPPDSITANCPGWGPNERSAATPPP